MSPCSCINDSNLACTVASDPTKDCSIRCLATTQAQVMVSVTRGRMQPVQPPTDDLQGILTPAEYKVSETKEGLLSIKRTRSTLVESDVSHLYEIIFNITNEKVDSFHTDLSSRTGERMMIFKMYNNIEDLFNK